MPTKAKIYIAGVITVGILLIAAGIFRWHSSGFVFPCLAMLALLASTLKVRLPQISSTISGNCIFILISLYFLSLSETLVIAGISAIVQSMWKPKRRPLPVQVAFNVGTLAISTTASCSVVHLVPSAFDYCRPLAITAAGCVLFLLNTGAVAFVFSLLEDKPQRSVWVKNYCFSFPFYLLASAIAALVGSSTNYQMWPFSAALFLVAISLLWVLRVGGLQIRFGEALESRRARRYGGVHAKVCLQWKDRHGKQNATCGELIDLSVLGARLQCRMPVSAEILRVESREYHLSLDAEVQSCRFIQGKYIVTIEFVINLTHQQLAGFVLSRELGR